MIMTFLQGELCQKEIW